jgi:GTPase SAR1 family protein
VRTNVTHTTRTKTYSISKMDESADGLSSTGSRTTAQSFKVVLLGEGCVGKTSLVLRYTEDKFNDKHVSTLQVGLNGLLAVH